MKRNILVLILVISSGVLMAGGSIVSNLTQRSKQQIIIHGNDVNSIVDRINRQYLSGYRVTSIVTQSISISVQSRNTDYGVNERKGDIIVIMER